MAAGISAITHGLLFHGDVRHARISNYSHVFLFLLPGGMEKIRPYLEGQLLQQQGQLGHKSNRVEERQSAVTITTNGWKFQGEFWEKSLWKRGQTPGGSDVFVYRFG
jgi:hypothetical protein